MSRVAVPADAQIDFIYFDPEHTDFHPGHIRIFAERASADPRIRSMHFVLSPALAEHDYAGVLNTIRTGAKLSLEFCSEEVMRVSKHHHEHPLGDRAGADTPQSGELNVRPP